MEDQEEVVDISIEDCKRWASDIEKQLDEVRRQDGEDTYRLMFMTAFLLQWFADSVKNDAAHLTLTKANGSVRKDLN